TPDGWWKRGCPDGQPPPARQIFNGGLKIHLESAVPECAVRAEGGTRDVLVAGSGVDVYRSDVLRHGVEHVICTDNEGVAITEGVGYLAAEDHFAVDPVVPAGVVAGGNGQILVIVVGLQRESPVSQ